MGPSVLKHQVLAHAGDQQDAAWNRAAKAGARQQILIVAGMLLTATVRSYHVLQAVPLRQHRVDATFTPSQPNKIKKCDGTGNITGYTSVDNADSGY